jgi:hypothetical protein
MIKIHAFLEKIDKTSPWDKELFPPGASKNYK